MDDIWQYGIDDTLIDDIDITNDYMFAYVMSDGDICIELLRYLLPGRNIKSIKYIVNEETDDKQRAPEIQKAIYANADKRGVRLDVYLDDGETIYDVEMQAASIPYLAKRARLYQAFMDVNQLNRGQNFDKLRPSFVIFICKFDPFGQGLYSYSFENKCNEIEGLKLCDEAHKLFFNTTGTKGNVSERLKELLKYMNDSKTYPVKETSDELIRTIDQRVEQSLRSVEWRRAYMIYQVKQRDAELRGEERGKQIGERIGEERGKLIGKQIGAQDTKRQIVDNMLKSGVNVEDIIKFAGLTAADIELLGLRNVH